MTAHTPVRRVGRPRKSNRDKLFSIDNSLLDKFESKCAFLNKIQSQVIAELMAEWVNEDNSTIEGLNRTSNSIDNRQAVLTAKYQEELADLARQKEAIIAHRSRIKTMELARMSPEYQAKIDERATFYINEGIHGGMDLHAVAMVNAKKYGVTVEAMFNDLNIRVAELQEAANLSVRGRSSTNRSIPTE